MLRDMFVSIVCVCVVCLKLTVPLCFGKICYKSAGGGTLI